MYFLVNAFNFFNFKIFLIDTKPTEYIKHTQSAQCRLIKKDATE